MKRAVIPKKTKVPRETAAPDGRRTRFDAHRAERESDLLSRVTILLAQKGLRTLTIDEIADDIGVKKPALYRYFSSKKKLIEAALDAARQGLVGADTANDHSDWRTNLLGALRFIADNPSSFVVLYRHAANDPEYSIYFQHYHADVLRLTNERIKLFSKEKNNTRYVTFCASVLVSFLFESTLKWLDAGGMNVDDFHRWLVKSASALLNAWEL